MSRYTFVYVWKKSDEFELIQSIRLLRKAHPDAYVVISGDRPKKAKADEYIKYISNNTCRATRVTEQILLACEKYPEFYVMYDDIFLNKKYDFTKNYHKGKMIVKNSIVSGYELCRLNTFRMLKSKDIEPLDYECHQPFYIKSTNLIQLCKHERELINKKHMIKSLYHNIFNHGIKNVKAVNFKVRERSTTLPQKYLDMYGIFSTPSGISQEVKAFIEKL
jgi:hypothetical protein